MIYAEDDTLGMLIDQVMRIPTNDPTRLDELDNSDIGFLIESSETLTRVLREELTRRRKNDIDNF